MNLYRCQLLILVFLHLPVLANEPEYSWPGLDVSTEHFSAEIKLRAQLRHTIEEPPSLGPTDPNKIRESRVNRSRIKIGGKAGLTGLTYYTEYDFPSHRLLDLRFTLNTTRDWLNFRLGQWKVPYNRERVDSSGKQQFADRSIANRWFTLDRQRGALLFGRIGSGSAFDSSYSLGLLEGAGRNGKGEVDTPMWLARWDWNITGAELAFSQSDTDYQENPGGVLSLLTASYRGSYTAFSSAGGGSLPGYDVGTEDQYRVRQYAVESAYQFHGFSWQQEYHTKTISDTRSGRKQKVHGGYAQVGFFPHGRWTTLPRQLEFALRYAHVDPVSSADHDSETEVTFGVNWFFSGHDNKLSFDYTDGRERQHDGRDARYHIIRLQWDFHI